MPITSSNAPPQPTHQCTMCCEDIDESIESMVQHVRPGTSSRTFYHRPCLDDMVASKVLKRLTDIAPGFIDPRTGFNPDRMSKALQDTAIAARRLWRARERQERITVDPDFPLGAIMAALEEPDQVDIPSGAAHDTSDSLPIQHNGTPLCINHVFSDTNFNNALRSQNEAIRSWFNTKEQVAREPFYHGLKQAGWLTLASLAIPPAQSSDTLTHLLHDQLHCLVISMGTAIATNAHAFPELHQRLLQQFVDHGQHALRALTQEGPSALRTMNPLPPLDANQKRALKGGLLDPILTAFATLKLISLGVKAVIYLRDEASDLKLNNLPTSLTAAIHFFGRSLLGSLSNNDSTNSTPPDWTPIAVIATVALISLVKYAITPTRIDQVFKDTEKQRHPEISDTVGGEPVQQTVKNYVSSLPLHYGARNSTNHPQSAHSEPAHPPQ